MYEHPRSELGYGEITSGQASALLAAIPGALRNDVNMFVMTAMIEQSGHVPDPIADVHAPTRPGGSLNQTFADQIFAAYDIDCRTGLIRCSTSSVTHAAQRELCEHPGSEFAFQHFFGESGFGIAGQLHFVDGDVGINVAGDPSVAQFALRGLSDTANATVIYEKFGFSARLAWNWRDEFLNQASRGGLPESDVRECVRGMGLNVSYDVSDDLALSFEAINLTGEDCAPADAPTSTTGSSRSCTRATCWELATSSTELERCRFGRGRCSQRPFSIELAGDPKVVLDAPWRKWLARAR